MGDSLIRLVGAAVLFVVLVFSVALIVRPDKFWRHLFYQHSEEALRALSSAPRWAFRACGVILLAGALMILRLWLPALEAWFSSTR